ncbi:MAG: hypothetical protein M3Y22_17440 [Pseudomonadota bacterium]|nr:hypothetical protein [Pseudomonadota bacterium]
MPSADAVVSYQADQNQDARVLASVFSAYIVSATIWLLFATAMVPSRVVLKLPGRHLRRN